MSDKRSHSLSIASTDSQSDGGISVVRFNPFDDMLFTILYMFHKKGRFPQEFWIFNLLINTLNFIGIAFRFCSWPISGKPHQLVADFLAYADFSISWSSDSFMLVMNIILIFAVLGELIMTIISTIISKQESKVINAFVHITNLYVNLMCSVFYYPVMNGLIGNFMCVGVKAEGTDPRLINPFNCQKPVHIAMMIVGAVFFLIHFVFTAVIRLFLFTHDMKKGDFWTCQNGFFAFTQQVLCSILIIVCILNRKQPITSAIVGLLIFILLMCYAMFLQPFFNQHGNASQASACSIAAICFLMGLFSEVAGSDMKGFVIALLWIFFVIAVIGAGVGVYFLTYKLSKQRWAMQDNDQIPILPTKKEQLFFSQSNQQPSTPSMNQLNNYGMMNQHNSNAVFEASNSQYLLGSNSNRQIPSVQQQAQIKNNPIPPNFLIELQQGVPGTQAVPARARSTSVVQHNVIQSSLYDQEGKNDAILNPPKKLKKFINLSQLQYALRFLTVKSLRKRKECLTFVEELLKIGNKRFGSQSEMHMLSALYYASFTINKQKEGESLRQTRQCIPNIIERWLVYALLHDIERHNSQQNGTGANALSVAFRIQLQKGQHFHELARAYLQQSYLMLSKDNIDYDKVMLFLDRTIEYESDGAEIFDKLVAQHSGSIQVLRSYGALLRDIYRDDETALMMFNEANAIEEELAAGGGDQDQDKHSRVSKQSGRSKHGSQQGQHKQSHRETVNSKNQVQSIKSGMDHKGKKKRKGRGTSLMSMQMQREKENLIPMFLPIIIGSMLIQTIALIIDFVLANATYSDSVVTVDTINKCTELAVICFDGLLYSKFFSTYHDVEDPSNNYSLEGVTSFPSLESTKQILLENSGLIKERVFEAYTRTKNKDEFASWEDNNYIREIHTNYEIDNITQEKIMTDMWAIPTNGIDLFSCLSNMLKDFSSEWFDQSQVESLNYLGYVRSNLQVVSLEALKRVCGKYSDNSEAASIQAIIIAVLLTAVTMISPLILNIVQFVHTLTKLKKERQEVFLRFCMTDKEEMILLKKRLDDAMHDEEDDENDLLMQHDLGTEQVSTMHTETEHEEEQQAEEQQAEEQQDQVNVAGDVEQGQEEQEQEGEQDGKEEKEETDEQRRAAEQADEAELQNELQEEEERRNELKTKIVKVTSFIPNIFYFRVFLGFSIILTFPLAFTAVAVISAVSSTSYNHLIFLSGYRTTLLGQAAVIMLNIAVPFSIKPYNIGIICEYSTNNVWNDVSHMSDDPKVQQQLLAGVLTFLAQLNQLVLLGSDSPYSPLTGDSFVDGHNCKRSIIPGSQNQIIQYNSTKCFQNREGDCDIEDRLYGQKGEFKGLEALTGLLSTSCTLISNNQNPETEILPQTPEVQLVVTLMRFDLQGGLEMYRDAVVEQHNQTSLLYSTLLILFFVIGLLAVLSGYILCIVPTKTILFSVARGSSKMKDLDPSIDAALRTGMGQASWKDDYSCDCPRFDREHQAILLYLAVVCGSIDHTMNVRDKLEEFRSNYTLSEETIFAIEEAEHTFMIKHRSQEATARAQAIEEQGGEVDEEDKTKQRIKTMENVIRILVQATFLGFADEDSLMVRYQVPAGHRRQHFSQHAVLIRKLLTQILSIIAILRGKGHKIVHKTGDKSAKGADESPIKGQVPAQYAQSLMKLYAGWLMDHVAKSDRELQTILAGKAPQSELEKEVVMGNLAEKVTKHHSAKLSIPHSYTRFLDSDNASIQDKNLFSRVQKALRLEIALEDLHHQ